MKRLFYFAPFLFCVLVTGMLNAQLANWKPVQAGINFPVNSSGQINGLARICQMKFHTTNQNKFYCVTAQGGLFLTNNQATSWTVAPGTENLNSSCASICVDYTNDQNLFLGTGDPNYYSNGQGVMKSTDGGVSFSSLSLTNCLVIEILQNPTNAAEFVAATNKGIYKSSNSGVTWVATTSTTLPFCDLKSNAAVNSQTLYACTRENVPQFFRSTNYGTSWTAITSGIATATAFITSGARIAVTPANTNIVYFEIISDGGIIHKSNDGGLNFHVKKIGGSPYLTFYNNVNTSSGQGDYNNTIGVDNTDESKLWLQSHNTWFSADSGATWSMLTFWANTVHTDMHQIQKAPFDNSKLYSCNDGGVWLSSDGGNTWATKSDGLYAYEIGNETAIGSFIKKDFVSIGTQDNGKLYGDSTGWYTIQGGDDYAKRQCDYNGSIYFDGANRQLNHTGASVTYALPTANWNAFGFNRTNSNLGFMGYTDVYKTTNLNSANPTWSLITNFNSTIKAVHSCIANPNRLFVLLSTGVVYISNNALSPSPTFYISTLPSSANSLGSIVSMANNADIAYISANNIVYRTSNGGLSWTNVTYNLPNVNHRRILAEDYGGTQELVFIATNNAVYYKKAGQTTWTNYSTNLPSRRSPTGFSMYDDGTSQSKIRYASYGRAIWETGFSNLRAFNAQILFPNDSAITCSSPFIKVSDGSVGTINAPITYTWNFPGGSPLTANTSTASVTYTSSGIYTISLTIKDALNNISTKTVSKFIQVISCNTDTIPGNAISINGTTNYGKTPPLALGITNSITISAWIKIDVVQPSFAGILFSPNGTATGLNFRNGNQIGYHYNGSANTYNYAGGPTIPQNTWVHVALATSANSATIYVNGVPYINNVSNPPLNFSSGFNLGNDRNNASRTMTGLMDEVCFYNRTLNQNEIRELMHLTKNHNVIDAGLKSYYQFNEVGQVIYDRSGNSNASLAGTSSHQLSTAPVGSGNSERMTINLPGVKTFSNEGVNLTFPFSTLPNGEICVTRLNIQPDSVPVGRTFTNTAIKYWIINNYGTNSSFAPITNITLTGYGNISPAQALGPRKYKLHRRVTGGFLAPSWNLVDSAYTASSGTNGVLSYSGTTIGSFNTQFTISRDSCLKAAAPSIAASNTVCYNATTTLSASGFLNDSGNWYWYNGSCGSNTLGVGSNITISPTVTSTYYVRGEGGCAAFGLCSAITISVIPSPMALGSIIGSSTICQGATASFSIQGQAFVNFYNWSLPLGWTGNSSTNQITLNAGSTGGTISVSASNLCGVSPASSIAIAVSPTITSSQSFTNCFGQKITIGISTYSTSGTYSNVLTRANGCDSLVITNLLIEPQIDISTFNSEFDISANANGATYQWFDCDSNSPIIGETGQSFVPSANGNYAVIVTINNCSDTSNCVNYLTTGLRTNNQNQQAKIYPIPGSTDIFIETNFSSGSIKLLNTLGQELIVSQITSQKEKMDIRSLAKGIYFVKIVSGNNQIIKKIIKD